MQNGTSKFLGCYHFMLKKQTKIFLEHVLMNSIQGLRGKMLNTNLPNIEPREKELLLERRHSICLEISKRRRQSVATSIFIPKDCFKTISKSNVNQKPTSRNKKFLTSVMNKKRIFGRILAKKKLKRLTILNKKKVFAKVPSSLSPLKHPESYPIVRQGVSSERIRCVVESLRDKMTEHSTTSTTTENSTSTINNTISKECQSKYEIELSASEILEIEQEQIQKMQTEQKKEIESFESSLHNVSNQSEVIYVPPKVDESSHITNMPTNLENESAAAQNKLSKPETAYSSINRVDNFLIIVDSSGSNVEIKYDEQPTVPSSNKSVALQNVSRNHEYTSRQSRSFKNMEKECVDYSKINNCTTTMNAKMVCSKPVCTFSSDSFGNPIGRYIEKTGITTDDTFKSNIKQSIQDIIDLTIRDTTGSTVNQPTKHTYPTPPNNPQTIHGTNTSPLPAYQTGFVCHRNRNFDKSFGGVNFAPCCSNYETIVRPKRSAQLPQAQFTSVKWHPLQSHHPIIQPMPYFETPPLSPREHQYMPMHKRMDYPMYEWHQSIHNKSIPRTPQPYIDSPANVLTNGLTCSSHTNAMRRSNQNSNQVSHRPVNVRHQQPFDFHNSYIEHHPRQVHEGHQTNLQQQRQPSHTQHQYHRRQPNQMNYAYQHHQTNNYHNIDLPRQFYHPLHQNLFPYPNHFSSSPAIPASTSGSQIFGALRMHNSPMTIIPPHGSIRSTQNYLPPTAPIADRNLPTEHFMPINFPFPSSNWANTLNNCSDPVKASSNLALPIHKYPMYPEFHYHTELTSQLNANASRASTSNVMNTDSGLSSHWPPTYVNTQPPPTFNLNNI